VKITDKEIKSFQAVFKKEYGYEITDEQAMISARALIEFMSVSLKNEKHDL
jgi:hypothetical protein